MTTSSKIKSEIKNVVQNYKPADYSLWTIGITSELETRKEAHGTPKDWHNWEASSEAEARIVEDYFINEFPEEKSKRMNGGVGGDIDGRKAVYVYIF